MIKSNKPVIEGEQMATQILRGLPSINFEYDTREILNPGPYRFNLSGDGQTIPETRIPLIIKDVAYKAVNALHGDYPPVHLLEAHGIEDVRVAAEVTSQGADYDDWQYFRTTRGHIEVNRIAIPTERIVVTTRPIDVLAALSRVQSLGLNRRGKETTEGDLRKLRAQCYGNPWITTIALIEAGVTQEQLLANFHAVFARKLKDGSTESNSTVANEYQRSLISYMYQQLTRSINAGKKNERSVSRVNQLTISVIGEALINAELATEEEIAAASQLVKTHRTAAANMVILSATEAYVRDMSQRHPQAMLKADGIVAMNKRFRGVFSSHVLTLYPTYIPNAPTLFLESTPPAPSNNENWRNPSRR